MSPTVVWDPAEGLAIARCQLARFADPAHRVSAVHPSACQWCPWPADELDRLIRGFNAWADRDRHGVYGAVEVRRFREQPEREQLAAISTAQALTGEPWPPPPEPMQPESVQPPADVPAPAPPPRPDWATPRPGGPA